MKIGYIIIAIMLFGLGFLYGDTMGIIDSEHVWNKPEGECISQHLDNHETILIQACGALAIQTKKQNDYLQSITGH